MGGNTYKSVLESVGSILGNDAQKKVQDQINRRQLVKALISMRVDAGLTQKDIADAIGCTQGRVSKIENGFDEDLQMRHIVVYAKLAKKDLTFLFSNHGSSVAEQIKHHALMIRRAFLQLAELAHKDEDIAKGVAGLHVQAFVNINKFLQESAEKLPPCPTNGEPFIRIERPSDLDSLASNVESRSAEAAIV